MLAMESNNVVAVWCAGDETPEAFMCKQQYDTNDEIRYDTNDEIRKCMFPNQDKNCWDKGWLE
jgi:hypothetical protein